MHAGSVPRGRQKVLRRDDAPLSHATLHQALTARARADGVRQDLRARAARKTYACAFLFCRLSTRSSTTAGSAKVEVSPRLPNSSSAILRRILRMILPERVFGSDGENWMRSGEAIGPISLRTQATSSLRNSSLGCSPAIKVTLA